MRPEWVAAFNVGLAVVMQITVANWKKTGKFEPQSWIPWKPMIACLHLSGLAFLVSGLPGTSLNWLAHLLFAATLACMFYFMFAILRNGPAYRRQQALLQKQKETATSDTRSISPVKTVGEVQQLRVPLTEAHLTQEESQILKHFR